MLAADRHLLFGLLALRNGLIDQNQLADAVRAWTNDKAQTLADHLVSLGHLTHTQRPAVEAITTIHMEAHDGRTERSLAAITVGPSTRTLLATVGDPELEQTLAHFGSGSEGDPDWTASFAVGAATSEGQRFRVLRPHARGGLGAVFVALDQELHREVALKQILDQHADNPIGRARFLIEAEITGGLEHPGIVPVYGLGTYADGRPYYAMRFIRGDSLKEAIDRFHVDADLKRDAGRRSLELRKLLRRFLDVCNAIDYAHSRGVLHRDIKPANIIVGKHGETLVVDWGLAKATGKAEPEAGEQTLMPSSASGSAETLPGSAMGTPAFMSPEQAEGDLEHLGTRSDVYSLGATLYYLLTGRQPVEGKLDAMLGAVKRGDIRPPRQVDATIDRALEAVCLKAMALRPEARYETAKALADDVERWMADEPATAWREPLSRRARRWAKRNRTAVTAAATALLASVVGLSAVLAVQTRAKADIARALGREMRANQELSRSRQAVQARYELAVDAIKTFHTGVSEDFLLKEERFQDLRDRLLKAASDFYGKLGALLGRETDVSSRRALAAANFELAGLTAKVGRNADALAAHRSVLAARRALAAEPRADAAAQADVGLSLTEVAGLLESAGKTDEALAIYREAEGVLSGPATESPEARAALAACRSRTGGFLTTIGKDAEALAAYRLARTDQETLAAAAGASPESRRDLGDTLNRIGRVLANTGKPSEAEAEYRKALAIRQKLADDYPANADIGNALSATYNNLGLVLASTGRPREAEAEQRKAMAIRQKLVDRNPAVSQFRDHLAASHFNLGILLVNMGRTAEAEAEQRQALTMYRDLAEQNPTVARFRNTLANTHVNLGRLLSIKGRPLEAQAEYRQALAIQRSLAEENPAVTEYRNSLALTHVNLGVLLAESGGPAESEFRAALAIQRELVDRNPTVTDYRTRLALGHVNLGDLLSETGHPSQAEPEYRAAMALYLELSDRNPAVSQFRHYLAYTHNHLGILLSEAGRLPEAEAEQRGAAALYGELAERNSKVPDYDDGVASALTNLGDVARRAGRAAEAREPYDRAVALRDRLAREHAKTPVYSGNLAGTLRRRALALRALGDPAGAAADARRALGLYDGLVSRSREEWYETACCQAEMAGLAGLAGSGVSEDEAASQADAAMVRLDKAVAMGYRRAGALRTESALDPLRGRDDFRLMMMDLEFPAEPFAEAR
jgi:serine/threonine-protein kinase